MQKHGCKSSIRLAYEIFMQQSKLTQKTIRILLSGLTICETVCNMSALFYGFTITVQSKRKLFKAFVISYSTVINMEDEFALFLVIGLFILAMLLAATNSFYFTPQENIAYPVPVTQTGDIRLVGIHGEDSSRIESFDFAVGTDVLGQDIGSKRLFSGLLFGDNEFVFETTEDTDVVTISFKVVETNRLGDLIIKVGGKQIEKRSLNLGEYTFTINGPVPSGTLIEIAPESSYWKIWAPTVYRITDIKISTTSFARQVQEFRFTLLDEYDFFRQGRTEIQTTQSYGSVRVILNGNEILDGALSTVNVLQFGKDKLIKGENVFRIEAEQESATAGSIDIVIFYEKQTDKELVLPFQVSKTDYDNMKGGFIKFEIIEVTAPGGVAIKTRSGDITRMNEFTTAAEGPVTVFFGKKDVTPGYNEVVVHGIEGATFKVKNIQVELR